MSKNKNVNAVSGGSHGSSENQVSRMKLLTVTEWIGPGRNHPSPGKVEEQTKTIAFATGLPLEAAINRLAEYQDAYNRHFSMAVNFTLQAVSEIEWISDGAMELMGVQLIETLPKIFIR